MSIYVAIEVLKFFQVRLIMSDKELVAVSETQTSSEKIYAKSLGVDARSRKKEKLQV